jgi:superfamily I DNA/RNA helicase
VDYHEYDDSKSQAAALQKVLSKFVSDPGFHARDVMILSPNRFDRSAAEELADNHEFRIKPVESIGRGPERVPTFAFATVQAFKGMESKVVVLCDVERIVTDEDRSLLYVAMSRARSHLTVLLHKRTKGVVREAFKKRMTDPWITNL